VRRIRDNLPPQLSFADRSLDGRARGGRVVNLYNEPLVALVPKPDKDRFLRMGHVPEHPLAVLVEGARRDDPRTRCLLGNLSCYTQRRTLVL
jgi:hypothetical protein